MREGCRRLRGIALLLLAVGVSPFVFAQDTAGPSNESRVVANTATMSFSQTGAAGDSLRGDSNTVMVTVAVPPPDTAQVPPPDIEFYRDANFGMRATATYAGAKLYLQASAAGCQRDSAVIEWIDIFVSAKGSQDTETYRAIETAADSGIFRVMEPVVTRIVAGAVTPQNQLLELRGSDTLTASISDCGGSDIASLLIDPFGVVFDSNTNLPVPGARVRLVDIPGLGNGGVAEGDALVFDFDGTTRLPATFVTDANGVFRFPQVAASTYRLEITPPGDYRFPSTATQFNANRHIDVSGSFGKAFDVDENTGTVVLDVPIDGAPNGLAIEKTASRQTAEITESIQYSISLRNVSGVGVSGATLHDELPVGFTYVAHSAAIDGVSIADPVGGKGPVLDFAVGAISAGSEPVLTYRVLIGAGALQGDGVNRAQLFSTAPARKHSNLSKATVQVQGGVFGDRAYVLGKIFADCNANHLQDIGESGIPGVRLYLEDGSFAVTDGEGKYSFYGVTPRTHVLKVDATTLPSGVSLATSSHRNAGSGNHRFIDVQRSELYRADFATQGCSPPLKEILAARQVTLQPNRELELGVKTELKTDKTVLGDVRALPASGFIGETSTTPVAAMTAAQPLTAGNAPRANALTALLPQLDRQLGFIGLHDGDALGTTQATIQVHGLAGAQLELRVNDMLIGSDRVGLRVSDTVRGVQAAEFVGVNLQVGENHLLLVQRDAGGNIREMVEIDVLAAGRGTHLNVAVPSQGIPADGMHEAVVHLQVVDADGIAVNARTPVTLESTLGQWLATDLDPNEPGTQIFIEGGNADVRLQAPLTTGTAEIRASGVGNETRAKVTFIAALRPMLAAGLVEGMLHFNTLDRHALSPVRRDDGFEREITAFAGGDAAHGGGGRAALFLKGKVRGDYLLTLGYDSDKDRNERLFRDIQPDQFYPVYGDSSVKGYDAQSTGKLYVRVDRGKSYLLGGDITTSAIDNQARALGAYNRSLTGVKEHYDSGPLTLDVFGSRDSTTQVIDEFPANGTSGPFFFSSTNALENSEKIEILTRDRNQPSIIVRAVPQQRFVDYEVEPLSGRILFRAPIPSVDPDLNLISVRMTYEVDRGGEKFWIAGVDSQVKLNEKIAVGTAFVDDQNPVDTRRLVSANTTILLGEKTKLIGEVVHTQRELHDDGQGERVEFQHDGAALQVRAYGTHTDIAFDNPSATFGAGRTEAGAKGGYSITESTRIVGEVIHSADAANDAKRDGGFVGVEESFHHNIKGELGLRHVIDDPDAGPKNTATSMRTKVSTPLPSLPRASVFGEYEQDIQTADNRVAAAGGIYQIAPRSKLYARHEFIASLTGPYDLDPTVKHNITVFGIDNSYWGDDRFFSEYRIADALSGRDAQAAMGLRNGWQIARGIRVNTSFERVDSMVGNPNAESTAATGAVEYTRSPLWKATARLELRDSAASKGALSTVGFAYKLSDDWTFLGKNAYALTDNDSAVPDRTQDRLQVGFAYRDSQTNRVNALTRYEFKLEDGVELGLKRQVHIISAHIDLQADPATVWRAQYAAKFNRETFGGLSIDSSAHLLGGRVTRDLGKRWDIGLAMRALFNGSFGQYQGGVGAEAGFLVRENLWLSAGYNVLGFRDTDLAAQEYTNRGGYLRLRFKFDESLLD